ncbi:ParB/Srx family N-terminal domain-containing protein [Comamonas testosteroni]|jgi:ParB-like chromosome segregation protein Spo0J|uniref:ParB/Srx family N-terminal domain-containing protein n=1 Tax=Comamonas testosteroni TaxID=285 RepID=UPI0026EC16FC|nr:ParB/Srx family N-terminal domain-containing protein [Comamonas testosteroni]
MTVNQVGTREAFDVEMEKIRLGKISPYLGADGSVLQEAQVKIDMLARSIQSEGQRSPIEVAVDEDGSYFVLDGELRVRAIEQLALASIKAFSSMHERKSGELIPITFQ